MSDWPDVALGEVMSLDLDTVEVDPGDVYDIVGVLNRGRGLLRREPMPGAATAYKKLNVIRPRQVVYSRLKAFEGAITVVPEDSPASFASQEFPTFTCGPNLLPDYFRLHTTTAALWERLQGLSTGMGGRRERVKPADFLTIRLPLPPLAEQRRIVDLVAAVDAQVSALQDEHSTASIVLEALRRDLLQPREHWQQATIAEVAVTATGRAFPNRYQGISDGLLPYFKVSDMVIEGNEREMRVAPNWLTAETMSAVKPRVCPAGTVIFPIIGAAMLTEKRRVLTRDAAFDQNVMGLVLSDRVTSDYMFAVMSTVRLGDIAQSGAVPMVNQKLVGAIPIAVPPIEDQETIGAILRDAHRHVEATQAELREAQSVRSALVSTLLSNGLEVPEAYDHFLEEVA